ncbi:MAG: hypothetical protein M3347_16410, partial [Armatimonadota bacterium]|nr:hypothetical protein [Armatimonadota bacterium]
IYTFAWGNPGWVTRFDADGQYVTQREGQFKWADPWSVHSGYAPLAVDPNDRLWAAATHRYSPDYVHYKTQRAVPAIVRTKADYFENPVNAVRRTPIRMLGFKPEVKCGLPYNVSYDLGQALPMEFNVAPANRNVDAVTVDWRVFDAFKDEIAKGRFDLALENGQDAQAAFNFTPPRYGAYFVHCTITSNGQTMGALGEHVGVTPRFANMPALQAGESPGGWEDAPRQMWSGLPNVRLHPGKSLDKLDKDLVLAEKYGATVSVQLVDNQKNFKPDEVRAIATRFKGRIKYYEVCNEPNFSGSVDDYFKIHQQAYQIIKEIDPQAQVMGPATVNIDLSWLRRLYELGFKNVTDIVSIHDYEGHESITPEHWTWKYAQMRQIMAAHGDGDKPIWQTERAIAGVRGNNFQGLVQAIRCTLHRDLLETFGIPSEHNNHYYLNQGGYSSVPTYVWSANGPHPAALALRTRHALTAALRRRFSGTLDFGATGNTLFMGVRYKDHDGETIVLRNLGARPMQLPFEVKGAMALEVIDCWGNANRVMVQGGKVGLALQQLPIYVKLAPGQELIAPKLNFGQNTAPRAKWEYSATFKGDYDLLTNGIYETYHSGNPNGDTNGAKIWTGDLPLDAAGAITPQTLDAIFERPQRIDTIIVRGVRADNAFCALLDYDLQYFDGKAWKTIEQVRNAMPPSEEARTADATHVIWMDDTNVYVHQFAPVTAERVRLVVRRASFGFVPDDRTKAWSNVLAPKLMLRELEIFMPQ